MANWSREEVELTVKAYFEMLTSELRGESFNKAASRRTLQPRLNGRSEASIELKHQNISAILIENGLPHIQGYKSRGNYQHMLAEVVLAEAARRGLTASGVEFPIQSWSWIVHSPSVATKAMDKSAFVNRGTGVPRDITFFFDYDPSRPAKPITLVHAGIEYPAKLSPDVENNRTRLFWQADFIDLVSRTFPRQLRAYSSGDSPDGPSPEMRLEKDGDRYQVEFIDPGLVSDDFDTPEEPGGRTEGKRSTSTTTRPERDPQNRLDAIRIHGLKCLVCGFDFAKEYGEWGAGYIEVHHLNPLGEVGEEHEVNPKTDLAPVCANCHRMIHRRRGTTLTLDELRAMLLSQASE